MKLCLAPGEKRNQEPNYAARSMRVDMEGWTRLCLTIMFFHNFLMNLYLDSLYHPRSTAQNPGAWSLMSPTPSGLEKETEA